MAVSVQDSSKSLHPAIRKGSLAEHCLHLHQHDLKVFVDKKQETGKTNVLEVAAPESTYMH